MDYTQKHYLGVWRPGVEAIKCAPSDWAGELLYGFDHHAVRRQRFVFSVKHTSMVVPNNGEGNLVRDEM
jgi:hypothetical protein